MWAVAVLCNEWCSQCDCSHTNYEAVLHRGPWTLAVCVVLLPVLRQLIGTQQEQRLERERERETRDRLHQSLSCVQTFGDAECSSCNDSAQVLRLYSGLQM